MGIRKNTGQLNKPSQWRKREAYLAFALVCPAFVLLLSVILYPLILNIWMSFHKILLLKPQLGTPFIALDNYLLSIKDPIFWRAAYNSFVWTVSSVGIQLGLGLTLALLLNQPIKGRGVLRGFMLIPWVTPGVVAALTWRWMYDAQFGIINHIMLKVGIIASSVAWLGSFDTAMPAVILTHGWKNFPFSMVMLLAALQTIPGELYEAADVDGANGLQKFTHITLPGIAPTLALTALLTSIWTFNNFDTIWLMTEGGPSHATEVLTTFVYKAAFQAYNLGKAASISVLMFLMMLTLVIVHSKFTLRKENV